MLFGNRSCQGLWFVEPRNITQRLSDYVVDLFHYPISWEYNVCKSKTRDITSTSEFEEEKKNAIRIHVITSELKKKKTYALQYPVIAGYNLINTFMLIKDAALCTRDIS